GGENRPLLPAAGGKAEHCCPREVGGKPVTGHGLMADEHHRPVTGPGPGGDIRPDRLGPFVFLVHLAVPGRPVIRDGVKVLGHGSETRPWLPGGAPGRWSACGDAAGAPTPRTIRYVPLCGFCSGLAPATGPVRRRGTSSRRCRDCPPPRCRTARLLVARRGRLEQQVRVRLEPRHLRE